MTRSSRVFIAEGLKLRRTLALRLAVVVPVAVIVLQTLISAQRPAIPKPGENPFVSLGQNAFMLWTLLALPVHGALIAATVAALDHEANRWKQLLTQPVALPAVFLAKWVTVFVLVLVSFVVLLAGIAGLEEALRWMKPAWRTAPRPLLLLSMTAVDAFCAATLFVSIQTWISLRSRNFITGPAVAVVAVLVMLGGAARFGAGSLFIRSYPWALPVTAISRLAEPTAGRMIVTLVGLIGGSVVTALGCWNLARREWL
jgi:hypothetical protein